MHSIAEIFNIGVRSSGPLAGRVESLERRVLLAFDNILVNDPNQDPPTSEHDTQSETSLLGFGSIVVVAYNDSGADDETNPPRQFTGWSRSDDAGTTFTDMGNLPLDTNSGDGAVGDSGDPVFARDTFNNRIYLATLSHGQGFPPNIRIQIFRSTDGGASFQQPVNATQAIPTAFHDKPWLTVDNFAGNSQGYVYLMFKSFTVDQVQEGIFLISSIDGGQTWGPAGGGVQTLIVSGHDPNPGAENQETQGAFVLVGPDHTLYALWYDPTAADGIERIRMRKSTDFGATFGASTVVTELHVPSGVGPNGNLGLTAATAIAPLPFRTNSFPHAAVNPVNGHLVYNDNPEGPDKADTFLQSSADGGNSWSDRIRLNDDATTTDQWQPTIAVTADGKNLLATFYDRRLDSQNDLIDRWAVIGAISGSTVTLRPNVRITTESFRPVVFVDTLVTNEYMGDYDQVVAEGDTFYLTWGDNRDMYLGPPTPPRTALMQDRQANVRFAKVPAALTVDGTTGPDTITVQRIAGTPDELRILLNGSPVFSGAYVSVNKLIINGLDGADTITLEDNSLGAVTINGGAGDDTISVLGDSPAAEVVVTGGAGDDILNVNTDNTGVARVRLTGSETFSQVNIGTGGGIVLDQDGDLVLRTQTLDIASTGFIDLADNEMIIDYTGTPSPLAMVQALLTSGYNNAAWTGNGIRSSSAAATVNDDHSTALGYAEASNLFMDFPAMFAGQQVDNTAVLLRYTYYGDANLSGSVNLGDFNRVAANFGFSDTVWFEGNFNYDTTTNLADFNLLADNWGQQGLGPGDEDDEGSGFTQYTYEDLLEMLLGGQGS